MTCMMQLDLAVARPHTVINCTGSLIPYLSVLDNSLMPLPKTKWSLKVIAVMIPLLSTGWRQLTTKDFSDT